MTLRGQMSAQAPAGRITDAEFPDQSRIMHSAPVEIIERLGTAIQLLLIERRGLLEHSSWNQLPERSRGSRLARLWRKDKPRDNWTKRIRSPPCPQP